MINFLKKHKNEFIVGIICSSIVSAIFYILSLQKVDMHYTLLTLPIANTWNDNNLQYNNTKINNLSLTIVTITNKGNKALNGNTMLKKTPLTVSLDKNFKILDIYNQDRKTSTSLDYSLVADNNSIAIPFEVINPNDTLRFSIIHTGYSNDDFSVTGNWENGNGIKQINDINKGLFFYQFLFLFTLLFFATFIIHLFQFNKKTINKYQDAFNEIYTIADNALKAANTDAISVQTHKPNSEDE